VIKLHGDYADLDQRNTADELAEYPEALQTYLRRVLDDYGLIISGWSGDWDTALVRALEETRSRRYPLFWSSYTTPGETAQRLIAQHGAVSLTGVAADDLFTGLLSRLEALDRLSDPPLTAEIAVQRLKRALPDPVRRIELSDLVDGEIQRLASRITDTTRHPLSGIPYDVQRTAYEEETATSARLLATGVFHGDDSHAFLWLRSLRRLMSARRPFTGTFDGTSEAMRHYPALLCLWAMGLSAILAERESLLARLLLEPTWTPVFGTRDPQPAVQCLNLNRIVAADPAAPGGQRWIYPASHHMRAVGRDMLRQLEPDDDAYKAACNRLEYFASLIAMAHKDPSARYPWAGEFILEGNQFSQDPELGGLLAGGAFNQDPELSGIPEVLLVTGWQPWAGPGRGGGQQLAR
jgi:hypothetical protein